MRVDDSPHLSAAELHAVLALVGDAARADGVAPLSEQSLLTLRGDVATAPAQSSGRHHLLAYDGDGADTDSTRLIGYAQLVKGQSPEAGGESAGEPAAAELVVAVASRRQGVARRLLQALHDLAPDVHVWSHGHLPSAQALAAHEGLAVVRELWQLRRPLGPSGTAGEVASTGLPEGFGWRTFAVGRDEAAWLSVNARAFAHHPEQGRLTLHDLAQRQSEPWFDPAGFLLVEDRRTAPATLAAFHWTKVHPSTSAGQDAIGEVYVVGVDPAYQGRGLARPLTVLGLEHLRDAGLSAAMLYVDGDNLAAVATYTRLAFRPWRVDAVYAFSPE